ncbi:hypothetical protein DPMN_021454, partial [Dreissena polymorpha]
RYHVTSATIRSKHDSETIDHRTIETKRSYAKTKMRCNETSDTVRLGDYRSSERSVTMPSLRQDEIDDLVRQVSKCNNEKDK